MSTDIELVVGLGNPGPRYDGTRHNLGFMVLDARAQRDGFRFKTETRAAVARYDSRYYLKPLTFMNLSGEAVGPFCARYHIPPARVLVVVDDLDLEPGTLRIRRGGSSGGHNGLKSLIHHLGTEGFPRLKMGIGHPPGDEPVIDWVLSRWPRADRAWWQSRIALANEAVDAVLHEGMDAAMSRFNG